MAEALTAPFAMHGARDAIASGLVHIEQQVKSIEQAVGRTPGSHSISPRRWSRAYAAPSSVSGRSPTATTMTFPSFSGQRPIACRFSQRERVPKARSDGVSHRRSTACTLRFRGSASYATSVGSRRMALAVRARLWSQCRRCWLRKRLTPS